MVQSMLFETVPIHYRKGARPTWHQRRRHRAVLRLMKGVTGRVLDYGCGYGDLANTISRTNPVLGCDVDPQRVAFASREYSPITFTQCDSAGTPFSDRSFEVIVSVVVIHFVPDATRYLNEVKRLLTPGGSLVILCLNRNVVRDTVGRLLGRNTAQERLWIPTMSDMRRFIGQAGFEIVDSTFFYDPPFDAWKGPQDWCFGAIQQFLSLLSVESTASYYGYRARLT